jgi:hypothetical protein
MNRNESNGLIPTPGSWRRLWHDERAMGLRWVVAMMLALFVVSSSDANAQAFKPRGGAKAPAKTAAKKAPAKKAPAKRTAKAKKTSRAAQSSARPDDLTPDETPVKRSAPEDDDDYVLIEDDDE